MVTQGINIYRPSRTVPGIEASIVYVFMKLSDPKAGCISFTWKILVEAAPIASLSLYYTLRASFVIISDRKARRKCFADF